MNKILQEYAEKALIWLEGGVGFVQGEIPSFIEELLRWRLSAGIIWLLVWIVGAVLCILLARYTYHYFEDEDTDGFEFIPLTFLGGGAFGSIVGVLNRLFVVVQILVAPRVYLLEYLTDLLGV